MLPKALKGHFTIALRRLLRPIVRQMIRWGVTYSSFNQIVKEVFLEVAHKDFALPFKRQTDSRLALVTGLHRKEIALMRRQDTYTDESVEVEDNVVTHAVGRWLSGPPYASSDGVPHVLPYESTDPTVGSFSSLVRDLGVDITVRAVLDELLHLGAANLLSNGDVELRSEAHIPGGAEEGKLTILGTDPAELFTTVVHNIENNEQPWLQRKVVYDNIGADALKALEAEARTLGEEFLRRANTVLARYDRDRNPSAPGGSRSRVVLGAYYYQDEPASAPSADAANSPPGRIRRPS